jgi:TPR repeat protein
MQHPRHPLRTNRQSVNGLLTTIAQFAGHAELQTGHQIMHMSRIAAADRGRDFATAAPGESLPADIRVAQYLAEATAGSASACFDLGVAFSTECQGVPGDLIEAHKWFNLAAVAGHDCAKTCRADIAEEMTAREIAEAQRRAREWIAQSRRAA